MDEDWYYDKWHEALAEIERLEAAMKECLDSYYHELGHRPWCIQVIDEAYKGGDDD